jgi:hypothetical protein
MISSEAWVFMLGGDLIVSVRFGSFAYQLVILWLGFLVLTH